MLPECGELDVVRSFGLESVRRLPGARGLGLGTWYVRCTTYCSARAALGVTNGIPVSRTASGLVASVPRSAQPSGRPRGALRHALPRPGDQRHMESTSSTAIAEPYREARHIKLMPGPGEFAAIVAFWMGYALLTLANRIFDQGGPSAAINGRIIVAAIEAVCWMILTPVLFAARRPRRSREQPLPARSLARAAAHRAGHDRIGGAARAHRPRASRGVHAISRTGRTRRGAWWPARGRAPLVRLLQRAHPRARRRRHGRGARVLAAPSCAPRPGDPAHEPARRGAPRRAAPPARSALPVQHAQRHRLARRARSARRAPHDRPARRPAAPQLRGRAASRRCRCARELALLDLYVDIVQVRFQDRLTRRHRASTTPCSTRSCRRSSCSRSSRTR